MSRQMRTLILNLIEIDRVTLNFIAIRRCGKVLATDKRRTLNQILLGRFDTPNSIVDLHFRLEILDLTEEFLCFSVLDSGVYSRSSGPSSEAPSTCSTTTTGGGSTALSGSSGSPQSSGASSGSSALIQPPPVVRSMSEDPTLTMSMGAPTADPTPHRTPRLLQHQQSLPVTQAEVASNQQRAFNRSNSRSDIIKQLVTFSPENLKDGLFPSAPRVHFKCHENDSTSRIL